MVEFNQKIKRLRDKLKSLELEGVLLTQQKNITWLTMGRTFVNQASERAVATVLVTLESVVLIANNIEVARLLEEEMTAPFDRVEIFQWYQPEKMIETVNQLTVGLRWKEDVHIEPHMAELRTVLQEEEVGRFKQLAQETADALEQTMFSLSQGETEFQIAARLSANCMERGIEPIVNLVGVDDRIYSRRHPLPTNKQLQHYALVVVCGRRKGQIVSASRLVHFGPPSEDVQRRHFAVATIDSMLMYHTKPGVRFGDLFEQMKSAYETVGFADEWNNHHQGGLSGFNSREQLLLPNHSLEVKSNQVYAWNPSVTGAKSEDTTLVTERGTEILTQTEHYPTVEICYQDQVYKRPAILIR